MAPVPSQFQAPTLENCRFQKKHLETTSQEREKYANIVNIITCPCWMFPAFAALFCDCMADRITLAEKDLPTNKCEIYFGCRSIRMGVDLKKEKKTDQFLLPPEREVMERVTNLISSHERLSKNNPEEDF